MAADHVGSLPASPPREDLYRSSSEVAIRASDSGSSILTGHFAVWDQFTEIRSRSEGHFLERFAPSSMSKTLSESKPKVLFQHGQDPQVGDKPLGTITRLEPDGTGAFYEVEMFDTSYNRDLIPALVAGEYGASFRFSIIEQDYIQRPKKSDYNPTGLPERTVREAKVFEFGPVTFPAYAGATAGVRSLTDHIRQATLLEDPEQLRQILEALKPRTATTSVFISDGRAWNKQEIPEEPEPSEATTPEGEDDRADAPEPPEATTQTDAEPEPSEATTRSEDTSLFWFVADPRTQERT